MICVALTPGILHYDSALVRTLIDQSFERPKLLQQPLPASMVSDRTGLLGLLPIAEQLEKPAIVALRTLVCATARVTSKQTTTTMSLTMSADELRHRDVFCQHRLRQLSGPVFV